MHGSNIYIGECTKMLDSVSFQFECIARLILAAFCGAIIGIERKNRLKEAGTRTHLVVAFGSAMFMIVSKYGFFDFAQYLAQASNEFIKVDPSRVASSIVTGHKRPYNGGRSLGNVGNRHGNRRRAVHRGSCRFAYTCNAAMAVTQREFFQ